MEDKKRKGPGRRRRIPLVCLSGVDGSGKSSHAQMAIRFLEERGYRPTYTWLRYQHLLSLPLLAYCRLRHLSGFYEVDGQRYGWWAFERSWVSRTIVPWFLLLDFFLFVAWKVWLPMMAGRTVVCDRLSLDTVVDIMMGTKDMMFHRKPVGRLLLRLLHPQGVIRILDANTETIVARRPELAHDEGLALRRRLYLLLARDLNIPVIDTSLPPKQAFALIVTGLEKAMNRHERVYDVVAWSWAQPFLRRRLFALGIAWVFQGLLYSGRTERILRMLLEGLLFVVLSTLLTLAASWYLAISLGLIMSHTISFLFYGQFIVVWKHFGPTSRTRNEVIDYLQVLQAQIQREPAILAAGLWGSFARGDPGEYPDIDLRLFRRPGFGNGLRATAFLMKERVRATVRGYPLDAYLWDSIDDAKRLRKDEFPVLLHDPQKVFDEMYPEATDLSNLIGAYPSNSEAVSD